MCVIFFEWDLLEFFIVLFLIMLCFQDYGFLFEEKENSKLDGLDGNLCFSERMYGCSFIGNRVGGEGVY